MIRFPIKSGLLQGDLDCAGHTLINLDLSGLNLTKASVGLGNVDNTSDANKPVSIATQAALDLKQDLLDTGDAGQFLAGGLFWSDYGDFIFESNQTNFNLISVKGANSTSASELKAARNDNPNIHAKISHYGASSFNSIAGIPAANVGMLAFEGAAYGLIRTSNTAPLIFAVNEVRRMRLAQGLNVGGDTDPGAGCITAFGTITAGTFAGITANALPALLNASQMPSLRITGAVGAGYITFNGQSVNPSQTAAHIFANSLGRIAIASGLNPTNKLSFNTESLTASRILQLIDFSGAVPLFSLTPPTASGDPGVAGQMSFNTSFFFVCVASNTWRRVAISAF